jgi:hypothetical protein
MFCSNCGKQISEGATFCGKCGHQITSQGNKASSVTEKLTYSPEELEQAHCYLLLIEQAKKTANKEMFKGIAWAVLGLLITVIGYAIVSDGETYFVFWGLVIYGAYIFIRGLYWRISPKSLFKKAFEATPDNPDENKK